MINFAKYILIFKRKLWFMLNFYFILSSIIILRTCEIIFRSMINLKWSKSNFVGCDESQREFPWYNESDVMKFINIKPDILPQNLVRGDNDEDTDNEDLENWTKYAYFELLKSLRLEMKLKAANSLQNIL